MKPSERPRTAMEIAVANLTEAARELANLRKFAEDVRHVLGLDPATALIDTLAIVQQREKFRRDVHYLLGKGIANDEKCLQAIRDLRSALSKTRAIVDPPTRTPFVADFDDCPADVKTLLAWADPYHTNGPLRDVQRVVAWMLLPVVATGVKGG